MKNSSKLLQAILKSQKALVKRMASTEKMVRAVINGQSALKQELLGEIKKVDRRLSGQVSNLESKVSQGFKQVNDRLDKQGGQLAYLEDDIPTREEHDKLETRVTKVEQRVASV